MGALYNLVFKRTSTYTVAIMGAVFFFERGFDVASEGLFHSINQGVSCKENYIMDVILINFLVFYRNCGGTSNTNTNRSFVMLNTI